MNINVLHCKLRLEIRWNKRKKCKVLGIVSAWLGGLTWGVWLQFAKCRFILRLRGHMGKGLD